MQIKKYNLISSGVLVLASLAVTILIIANSSTIEERLMALLPFTYIASVMFSGAFINLIDFSSPGCMVINFLYFIKCVVYPFVNVLSGSTYYKGNKDTMYAIILEIGEIIVIYLIFFLYNKLHSRSIKANVEYSLQQNHLDNGRFIIFCFLIFVGVIILVFPSALNSYNFFTVQSLEIIYDGLSESDDSGFVTLIIKLARYIIVAYTFGWLFCKYRKTKKTWYIICAIVIVALSIMIVRGVSRSDFIIPGLCGYLLLIRLFPKHSKIISIFLLGCMVFVFAVFSLMRYGKVASLGEFSETLQAYFCCEKNMSIAIYARRTYIDEIGFKTLLSDLFGNWAGVGELFRNDYNISEYFNFVYHGHQLAVDQIVPTIGQAYMQFGVFGTYIYTAIMTLVCLILDKKYRESDKLEFSYLYLYGTIKCAVTLMGNFKIFSATVFNVLLPMLLLFWLNKIVAMRRTVK